MRVMGNYQDHFITMNPNNDTIRLFDKCKTSDDVTIAVKRVTLRIFFQKIIRHLPIVKRVYRPPLY